jgi:hypothetical protein
MKLNIPHILISITLIACLLIPLSIGTFHAINSHEHDVCSASNEQHLHKQNLTCSHLFYISNTKIENKDLDFHLYIPSFYQSIEYNLKSSFSSYMNSTPLDRGPPDFMLS